ncbi:hypothetical protein [Halomonas sp. BC04]|uniref:hypothetical protein n=1 Tax=Halomonas sp. BC04 TaxID=1403540 RepID=UPI0003ED7CA7|nr:hypothetical protein [Halomonas sp. BC04]EWH01664.1 hypothetical protein Q427_12965 [Halomonas sp. BC04]
MMKKLFAALVLLAFVSPAWAATCPMLMGEIDEALADDAKVAQLSETELEQVNQLRQEGEEAHNAGDHARSEEMLNEAKEILGV